MPLPDPGTQAAIVGLMKTARARNHALMEEAGALRTRAGEVIGEARREMEEILADWGRGG